MQRLILVPYDISSFRDMSLYTVGVLQSVGAANNSGSYKVELADQ